METGIFALSPYSPLPPPTKYERKRERERERERERQTDKQAGRQTNKETNRDRKTCIDKKGHETALGPLPFPAHDRRWPSEACEVQGSATQTRTWMTSFLDQGGLPGGKQEHAPRHHSSGLAIMS